MTREEAARILEQLLNGIHPVTGEVLAGDHVCSEVEVMRALHMGYAVLMQTQTEMHSDQERESFVPAGREKTHLPWTDEEDRYLRQAWAENVTVDDMRRQLRRTLRSVKCRLVYLGVADYAILERKYQPPAGCEHSGLPWYPEEEEAVKALYAAGISPREIARQLKRTLRAVALRMVHLALISEEELETILVS